MRVTRAVAVGAALAGLVLAPAAGAQSATDKTPPVLKTPISADFRVGYSIDTDDAYGCGNPGEFTNAAETFSWTGSDNSGYVRYTVEQAASDEAPYVLEKNSTVTTINASGTNYFDDCGGDGTIGGFSVTATDKAGNKTTKGVQASFDFLQDDDATIQYTGTWAISHCQCWSGLTDHDTSAAQASATITVPAGTHHVGLVMPVGPPQGSAQIVVDGVVKGTVNTYATTKAPRVIVWDGMVTATQAHTIKIVNLATSGHPRIDLDAVLLD